MKCNIPECEGTTAKGGKGLCGKHFMRLKRYGDVNYITPKEEACRHQREAQLRNIQSVKSSTYRKYFGRHEHRVIAEQKIGRALRNGEEVHHIDGNKQNNDPSNLMILDKSEHDKLHVKDTGFQKGHGGTHCKHGHEFIPENTYINPRGARVCRICQRNRDQAYKKAHRNV